VCPLTYSGSGDGVSKEKKGKKGKGKGPGWVDKSVLMNPTGKDRGWGESEKPK